MDNMKCRRIYQEENGRQTVVWFGSYGATLQKGENVTITKSLYGDESVVDIIIKNIYLAENTISIDGPEEFSGTINTYYLFNDDTTQLINSKTITSGTINNEFDIITAEEEINNIKGILIRFTMSIGYENSNQKTYISYYKNDYKSKFFNEEDKHDNYSTLQEGVRDSLVQRLSVIKGELWYKKSYGLPLLEKIKNKGIYDSIIISIIWEHPDVKNIVRFNSKIEDGVYIFNFVVTTVYSEEGLEIDLKI